MESTHKNAAVHGNFDGEIATLTLEMEGRANKINAVFGLGLKEALDWALAQEGLKGIILATGHKDFCVGADLDLLYAERDPKRIYEGCRQLQTLFREIETCGVPVVCALTGSALGGGYELALSCHHRIALKDPKVQVGLPEVLLGVIPGAGGTQRLPRMLGYQVALEHILQGKIVRAPKALKVGLVDALAESREALDEAAREWISAHPRAVNPWDKSDFKFPAPAPGSDDARNLFVVACAMLTKKTGGVFPSPKTAIEAVQEGSGIRFDRALEVEARHFTKLAVSDCAKDMIRTFFFHRTAVEKHEGLPHVDSAQVDKVAILGAGMMGAGLAFLFAKAGHQVVLKDVAQEGLDLGMTHCRTQAKKLRHLSKEAQDEVLNRIQPSLDLEDLRGVDLVIEAVFEDLALKHRVIKEVEPLLSEDAIFASNTSAIPIEDLAKASTKPENFIGLHFFSPVEKMPLLEIITPPATSERTIGRALALAKAIKKLPIVVNDGYGFYTTRTFSSYIIEGAQMVSEGHDPVLVEHAAKVAGMVVSPLKCFDEVSLKLGAHAIKQGRAYLGDSMNIGGVRLVSKMVELNRLGKAAGAGFYDYEGKRQLWPGLKDLAESKPEKTGVDYLAKRFLLVQVAQVGHCLDSGVLKNHRDAEIGAIFGIGFAPHTGGPLAWMDRQGLQNVVKDLDAMSEQCGERYTPSATLRAMAEKGERFFEA
jgi:3-hydroxyacyl-CoA dehydrogenase/enoyl-CoA hydratase/3-hydroxybutyryl-CoA epimerase